MANSLDISNQVTEELVPQLEGFDKNRNDYIKALEKAVQILQREVEHLRNQKTSSESESVQALDETAEESDDKLSSAGDFLELIGSIENNIPTEFEIAESNIFLISKKKLKPIAEIENSVQFGESITKMNEEGILDWVADGKQPRSVPNLNDGEGKSSYLVSPLLVAENLIGYLIALSRKEASFFDETKLSIIAKLSPTVANAVDNIKSSDEIKNMNNQLIELNNRMLHSSQMASIAEITKSLVGELDAPIQVIKGNINFVELGLGDTPARIKIIKDQVEHIETITAKIKKFTAETDSNSFLSLEINSLIGEVLLFSDSQFLRDNIEIVKNFSENLPEINANKAQLEQSILSILFFFRDTLPEGGTISVATSLNKKKFVSVIISCSKDEYEEEELKRILRGKSEKIKGNNNLYALSMLPGVMKEHKSKIEVISIFGKGTSFKLHFPVISS